MDKSIEVKAFTKLASLQDALNTVVNPSWRHAQYPWYRALWTEAGEAAGYVAWPWWRSVGPNLFAKRQDRLHFFLELVDCLHFGISMELQRLATGDGEEQDHQHVGEMLAEDLKSAADLTASDKDLMYFMERVASQALEGEFDARALFAASYRAGMGTQGIIAYFHAKNLLNGFRQEHGYKQGTYRKNWGTEKEPREDNLVLAEIVEDYRTVWGDNSLAAQVENGDFGRHIRRSLNEHYQSLE